MAEPTCILYLCIQTYIDDGYPDKGRSSPNMGYYKHK